MLQLFSPYLLIGLLGLLLPLVIHFWNRKAGKRVLVGSTQWLIPGEKQQFNTLQFSDPLLFFCRVLLIGLFTFLLTQPFLDNFFPAKEKLIQKWVLISPEEFPASIQSEIDTLKSKGFELRYLSENFPLQEEELNQVSNIWPLLKRLETSKNRPDSLIIYTPPLGAKVNGTKPELALPIEWRILPISEESTFFILDAWAGDKVINAIIGKTTSTGTNFQEINWSIEKEAFVSKEFPKLLIQQNGSEQFLSFAQDVTNKVLIKQNNELQVAIIYDPIFKQEAQLLELALRTIGRYTGRTISVKKELAKSYSKEDVGDKYTLFWLSQKQVPTTINLDKTIEYQPSSRSSKDFEKIDNQHFIIKKRLDFEQNGLIQNQLFLEELLTILFNEKISAYQKVTKQKDKRVIAEHQFLPLKKNVEKEVTLAQNSTSLFLHFPLWLGLMSLFLLERLLAKR